MGATDETIQLADGTSVNLRSPRHDDADALLAFLRGLPDDSRHCRFLNPGGDAQSAAEIAAGADGVDNLGVVALDAAGRVVGHASCARLYGRRGEISMAVELAHSHRGLEPLMLRRLAHDAEAQGIRRLIAEVPCDDAEMLTGWRGELGVTDGARNGKAHLPMLPGPA